MRIILILFTLFNSLLLSCNRQPDPARLLPPHFLPVAADITDLNAWREKDRFFLTGICTNNTDSWQKIWLRLQALDSTGQAIELIATADPVFPTFSDAMPPRGRTAFFQSWALSSFKGLPASARVMAAGAEPRTAGPILLAEETGGVRMIDNNKVEEVGWQGSVVLHNVLNLSAPHPRAELLIYGTDQRLWMTIILNPEDPTQQATLLAERPGSMQPQEKRQLDCKIFYDQLPERLRQLKIGRIEFLAFTAR